MIRYLLVWTAILSGAWLIAVGFGWVAWQAFGWGT